MELDLNYTSATPDTYETQAHDECIDKYGRLIADTAPDYPNQLLRANMWPVDLPPKLKQALLKTLPPDSAPMLQEFEAMNAAQRRMFEIAREAALQGKLKLSKNSARDYPAPKTGPTQTTK